MAVELYGEAPEDVEDIVLAWLLPLTGDPTPNPNALGADRPDGGALPFRMVTGLNTKPDPNLFYVESLVSVHTFDKTRTLAKRAAKDTQRRMDVLCDNPLSDIVMADARIANVEFCDCLERYHYEPYGVDTVRRYVARFNIGLSFVAVS